MAISDEQIAFVHDLFAEIGPLTTRKMFGGLAIYKDGVIFALGIDDGQLMLKGAGDMPAAYEAEGWARWFYTRLGRSDTAMPYWIMPDSLLDDPEAATDWARRALAAL